MTPPGHLAMAYLTIRQRVPVARRAQVALLAMFGALLPDVIDKSLVVLGVYPWGRTMGHSLITWTLVASFLVLIATLVRPLPRSTWVVAGVISHFLADLTDDAFAGFLHTSYVLTSWFAWPLFNPDQFEIRVRPLLGAPEVAPTYYEIAVLGAAVILMFWDGRRMGGNGLEVPDAGEPAVPRGDDPS